MANQHRQLTRRAPAKINLFLHIIGRRPDGYHNLQTVFQFLDRCDILHFTRKPENDITLSSALPGVADNDNLIMKAAKLLKTSTNCPLGADIRLEKNIPMGSGLGGGSSDAATTLLALNELWELQLPTAALMPLGRKLGADVGIFLYQKTAFAEGIGDELTAIDTPMPWYVILVPSVHVSTPAMYAHPSLKRDTAPITAADYLKGVPCHNDFSPLVCQEYPLIKEALSWLSQFGPARLTGSGAGLFLPCKSEAQAIDIVGQIPTGMIGFAAKGQNQAPF